MRCVSCRIRSSPDAATIRDPPLDADQVAHWPTCAKPMRLAGNGQPPVVVLLSSARGGYSAVNMPQCRKLSLRLGQPFGPYILATFDQPWFVVDAVAPSRPGAIRPACELSDRRPRAWRAARGRAVARSAL